MFQLIIKVLVIIILTNSLLLKANDVDQISADLKVQGIMKEFDPNGLQTNSNSTDGNFSVTPSNLNAIYSIPLSYEEYNGTGIEFSLHYNGGIEHKAILGKSTSSTLGYRTYSKKIPAWLLSVNGFVVEAFVENRTIFADPHLYSASRYGGGYLNTVSPGNKKYIFSNKDFNFSIQGYHYNNMILPFNYSPSTTLYRSEFNSDKIHILKSDGSLLTLINDEDAKQAHKPYHMRTGTYLEFGANSTGYAKVTALSDPAICDEEIVNGYEEQQRQRRMVRYFPGDGLEYVFIEYITPYGIDITSFSGEGNIESTILAQDLHVQTLKNVSDYSPTIFYLSEILNDNQSIATFYYERHHPYTEPICSDGSFGRARLVNFNNNWIDYGEGEINIKTENRNTKLHFHNSGIGNKFSHLNAYGGKIDDWKPNDSSLEINLDTAANIPNFLGNIEFMRTISRNISKGKYVREIFYEHSFDSDYPKSDNHFYALRYVDYLLITEKDDENPEEGKLKEKKIDFEYEAITKKLDISDAFTFEGYHPVLPFLGDFTNPFLDDEHPTETSSQYKDILASSIKLRDLRLKSIKEPSKIIDLEYYDDHNELEYGDLISPNDKLEPFHFTNHCVKKVKYSYSDDIFSLNPTKSLYLIETNDQYLSEKLSKNVKTNEYYNPENNSKYLTVINTTINEVLSVAAKVLASKYSFFNYSSIQPIYQSTEYKSHELVGTEPSFLDIKNETFIGYKNLSKNNETLNYIKPFYTRTTVEQDGVKINNSLVFYEYELDDGSENYREITDHDGAKSFKYLINKKISYIFTPDLFFTDAYLTSEDYDGFWENRKDDFLLKEEQEFINYEMGEDHQTINISKQFYNNENAFLKKYYDSSYLEDSENYYSKWDRIINDLFGNEAPISNHQNQNVQSKNNNTQATGYEVTSDQYSLEYYLCYLLSDIRHTDGNYYQDYGNSEITVKPKFGILKSSKIYKNDNPEPILLKGVEYLLEDEAFNNTNLTYSQGKVKEERIFESELYGGNPSDYIMNKLIEYSVGAQGGGYPSKIYTPNGAFTQNYYVYNQTLHFNELNTNPVYTMQDYWDPSLTDTDNYPCDNKDYFTPAGKVVDNLRYSYKDKLIESKDVFRRTKPVGSRAFVRKFKPYNGNIEYFNKFPNPSFPDNIPFEVTQNSAPTHESGSLYVPVNKEILSLNKAFEYDDLGRLTAEVDVNGFITRYDYDNFDRVKKVNLPYDYNSTNYEESTTFVSRIVIDGVTRTKESYVEMNYNIDHNANPCKIEIAGISPLKENNEVVGDRVIYDTFKAGGESFTYSKSSENCSGLEGVNSIKEPKTYSTGIVTFRTPVRVAEILSLDRAFISLNIKDIPTIQRLSNDYEYVHYDNILLYLRIKDLNDTDGNEYLVNIVISYNDLVTVANPDELDGINQLDGRIILELGDKIDLNELVTLMNEDESFGQNGESESTKLVLEIGYEGQISIYNSIENFRGTVEFYNNSVQKNLNPKLVLEGQFLTHTIKDKAYYVKDEFTLMNNYGDFGDYVNSYRKIDNKSDPSTELSHMNFYNNYSKLGYNYSVSNSKVQDNSLSNGFYYLKKPVGYDNSSLNLVYNNLGSNNNLISSTVSIYDEDKNHVSDLYTQNKYFGTGELLETELNDGTKLNIEHSYSDASEFTANYPDINFYGFSKKVKTIKHDTNNDIADLDIYDMFGNLVLSFKNITDSSSWNPGVDQYSKLVKYYYDLNKNVRKVSEYTGATNQFRNIFYWYDVFGRVNHSFHPDFGYTHFNYDNTGNLRFKQDQKQFEDDRVSYYQYDDLNRLVVSGDAKIAPNNFPNSFTPTIQNSTTPEIAVFNTMLDVKDVNGDFIINPNLLNDDNTSIDVDNKSVLTSNKTLWIDENVYDCYIYDGIINDTLYKINSVPLILDKANSILGTDYDLPPKGIVHKNYVFNDTEYPNNTNNGASPTDFEHIGWYHNFLRRVNFYDELPSRIGKFWKYMPKTEFIDYLSYDNGISNDAEATLYNLRGRVAVQAYREYENQPFNFIYYSYDARGRIESLIRFTENLGFDCIYYQYNSLDKITKMNVVGPYESIKTAYEYDGFGRLEKVYSNVFGFGHGLASLTGTYKDFLEGSPPSNSLSINFLNHITMQPDIVYTYDSDNKIASTTYSPSTVNIKITNTYDNALRMLAEIKAIDNNSNELFKENLGYDLLQRINNVSNAHYLNGALIKNDNMEYGYDDINQLVDWTENMLPIQHFNYDVLGNRTSSMNFQDAPDIFINYTYDITNPESSRLLQADQPTKWKHTYDYYSTGQLKERTKSKKVTNAQPGGQDAVWTHTKEKFDYNSFGLLREYKSDYYFGSDDCIKPYNESEEVIWRYGYNPFNERESKRMVKSPDGDMGGNTYPMMYYLLDEKNRQHINYLGMQSSNSSLKSIDPNSPNFPTNVPNKFPDYYWPTCQWYYHYNPNPPNPIPPPPPSKSEQVLIYPAQMNVFGGGSSPQISYKYDNASTSWKKHFNIYDHLGTLAQTYKQNGFGATPTSMQTHNPYGGERWTNSNLTETESTLLNWVGKEKDNESKLGDHGVRKYEYETGRFISIDPLWSSYYGWTPYQYSMNSPVMLVDIDGEQPKVNNRYQDNLKDNTVYNRVFPQPTTCSSCTDYSTVGKNFLGLTYTGSENPKNKLKEETFNYKPKRLADYPSIGHDRRYNNLGAKGSESLFLDTRTIGADWQFVAEQMAISLGPGIPVTERMYSYLAGGLLGIAATPKTLFSMFLRGPALFSEHTLYWYNESNEGVTNKPEEHKHEE